MKIRFIFPSLITLMLLPSCVSKKKFMFMQDTYISRTDSLVTVTEGLNAQLASGEADFESTKQDLMINDAAKNDQIAALETQLKELQSSFDEVTNTLSDTKDRYEATQSAKDRASYQMARMNSELARLRQDTVSLNYALSLEKRKSSNLKASLDEQIKKYGSEVGEHKKELAEAKKASETSRLKTKELERRLTLKQKQIEEINTAFVALRKELLRAKVQGEAIDPNNNSNINKIAKGLGQY